MTTGLNARRLFCLYLALACALVAGDQWLKMKIVEGFSLGDSVYVTSFFNVVRAHNTGAAFSFLANAGGWQHWFFLGVAAVVVVAIVAMLWSNSTQKVTSFALACILGGAIGNVIDRMRLGYVVDFLDFHWGGVHFPAFNLADMAICLGAGLLILHEVFVLIKNRGSQEKS